MAGSAQNHTGRRRSERRGGKPVGRLQSTLGWAALAAVMAGILRNGALAPVAWVMLCMAVLGLFAVQAALDLRGGVPDPSRKALWIALPFGAVLVWVHLQAAAGLPPGLAHPVWALAPEGAAPTISAHPEAGRQLAMRLFCYALVFWIALRSAAAAHGGGMAMIQAIALFSSALALYGLAANALGANPLLGADEGAQSVRASFSNRNAYATVAVFGVLANVTAYLRSVSGRRGQANDNMLRDLLEGFFSGGWIFAFGTLVGTVALALTGSRAGVLAGGIGLAVLLWALRRGRATNGSLALLVVPVALIGLVALVLGAGIAQSFGTAGEDARLAIYAQVLVGISDRPLLGHGAGAFAEAFRVYVPLESAGFDWTLAHSTYLENAFEFGLPAATLFFLVLALIGWRLLRGVLTRRRNRSMPAFALACFAAAGFHAAFDFSLQYPATAALFAMILGLGWAQSYPTRRPAAPKPD